MVSVPALREGSQDGAALGGGHRRGPQGGAGWTQQLRSHASWDSVPVDVRLTEGHGQRSGGHGANADGDRRNTGEGEQTGGEEN